MIEKIIIPATLSLIASVDKNNTSNIYQIISEDKIIETNKEFHTPVTSLKDSTLTKKEVLEIIIQIASNTNGVAEEEFGLTVPYSSLGFDSLDEVELVMNFEEKFNILIPDNIAEEMKTIQNSFDFIYEVLNNEGIFLYSNKNMTGEFKKITTNFSSVYLNFDVSKLSIIVPKGYRILLYSRPNYYGKLIAIDASKKRRKIKDFAKAQNKKYIQFDKSWKNGEIESIKIEKLNSRNE